MKRLDDRVQELLDGELGPREQAAVREALPADAKEDLGALEKAIATGRRREFELPAGFEKRVMQRIAVRPAPRRSFLDALLAPRWFGEWSFASAGAFAAAAAVLVVLATGIGYRLGERRQGTPAIAPPQVAAAAPSDEDQRVLVRFALSAPEAKKVELVGSFNGWGAAGVELTQAGNGVWSAAVPLAKGHYQYTFVVDGERWVPDPSAAQLADDGFGGRNAVLEL